MAAADGQHVLHSRGELDAVDRFGEEIVGAGFEGTVAHFPFVVGRHHQQRHVRLVRQGAQAQDEFDAVGSRHHVIDDDQIGRVVDAPLQAGGRFGEADRRASLDAIDQRLHQGDVDLGVIDDDDIHGRSRSRGSCCDLAHMSQAVPSAASRPAR